ncbi:MAG: phosphotransferase [Vicinamibacterales bacterium]
MTLALTTRTGLPVVAKVYPCGSGDRVFGNMLRVWRSPFGENRRPPGLPRPVDYLPDLGILVMERVEGFPLAEHNHIEPMVLDDVVRLLVSLHESSATSGLVRSSKGIVKSVQRKAGHAAMLAPELSESFHRAADALGACRVEDRELVASHGDFSPRNLVLGRDRLALIDWDRFQVADPARDVAYLGLWSWAARVRKKQTADWSVLDRTVAHYDSLRPQAAITQRLHFHVAAGLLRVAHSVVTLWPTERSVVPCLIREAERQLRIG